MQEHHVMGLSEAPCDKGRDKVTFQITLRYGAFTIDV